MTPPTLILLSLPLLVAPLMAPEARRGRAMARLIVAGFALGALWIAAGITSLSDLGPYASTDASNALFISITLGLLLGALGPWPLPLDRLSWLVGLPIVVGPIMVTLGAMRWPAFFLGAILGALPLFVGLAIPAARRNRDPDLREATHARWLVITLLVAAAEPLVLLTLLPVPWLLPRRRGSPSLAGSRRILPLVGFVLLVVLSWLALTIAGSPWARLGTFAATQPLSIGAERLLAVLGISALIALLAPWPLGRLGPVLVPLPAIVVAGYRLATTLAPQGVAAWLPGTALLLVPSALFAALLGRWRTALGTVALLGALTGNSLGFGGGLLLTLLAVWPSFLPGDFDHRVTFFEVPWRAILIAVAVALVVVALLQVEVVMATCLAAGSATMLARVPRIADAVALPPLIPES